MTKKMYIFNLLYGVFQVALVLGAVVLLTDKNSVAVILTIIFIVIIHMAIFFKQYQKNPFGESKDVKEVDFDDRYLDMIKKAEEIKGCKIPVKFIEFERLHYPAFYHKGIVYINNANKSYPSQYIEGLIAHELGHAISGYADDFVFAQVKMSNVARAIIVSIRQAFMRKENKELNQYVEGFLYYLMRSLTWLDEYILFKYLRIEEYEANKNACLISDGFSLRTYYYHVHRRRRKQRFEFDVIHPAPKAMIIRMEKYMDLNEYNKDVYAVDDKIYYVVNKMNVRDQNIAKFNFYIHCGNQENPYVNNRISDCYFKGKGVEKDIDQALFYALKAESQGSTKGLFNIGQFYELKEDYENALVYYSKAKQEGSTVAGRKIREMTAKVDGLREV